MSAFAPTAGTNAAAHQLYGGLEDEKPFNRVRRLVQQADYALPLLYHGADVRSPEPYGIVAITPWDYLIAVTRLDGQHRGCRT